MQIEISYSEKNKQQSDVIDCISFSFGFNADAFGVHALRILYVKPDGTKAISFRFYRGSIIITHKGKAGENNG